jgi:hypothetical protein
MRERLGLERQLTVLRRSVEEPLWRESQLADPYATGAITPAAIGQNIDRITVATRNVAVGMQPNFIRLNEIAPKHSRETQRFRGGGESPQGGLQGLKASEAAKEAARRAAAAAAPQKSGS